MFKFKGELGKLEFYFRKIPLHQQKFLVVSDTFRQATVHARIFCTVSVAR